MLTLDERVERGGMLCEKLEREVRAIVPPQFVASPETRHFVDAVDAEFLIALTAWEATGEETDRLRVRDAYLAITDAWKSITQPPTPTHESARDIAS